MRIRNIWRWTLFLLCFSTAILAVMLGWRARPVMLENESFNSFFPKKRFQEAMRAPVPDWMERQLDSDFRAIAPITTTAVETTFATIESRTRALQLRFDHCVHYRILDNKLYKFIPEGTECSPRDTQFEKAFKTLLSHANVSDVDFILCPMDGLPEAYMEPDFYLTEDPKNQAPILAQSKLKEPLTRSIVLIPDLFSLSKSWYEIAPEVLSLNDRIPWQQKKGVAFWRGAFTDKGTPNGEYPLFEQTPRLEICRLSLEQPNLINAGLTGIEPLADPAVYERLGLMKNMASREEHLHYKYLPVLDGHMCTYPGYQWRLLSDSVCFKQESDQVQWFYSALKPYEHYIPIANDMSDLAERVRWAEEHDELVQQIMANARDFASRHLKIEDDYRYLYLVLERYASMQKIDFKALKKETRADPHWVCIQYRKRAALMKMFRRLRERVQPA